MEILLTNVEEGTAKAVKRFKGFLKIIMKWEGHKLAESDEVDAAGNVVVDGYKKGDVIPIKDSSSFWGGLRYIGIPFIDTIHHYKFRWRGIQLVKGKEEIRFEEKIINYILVRPDVYATEIEKAETRPPERIPLTIRFLVTMRVLNPEKALFKAPSNWFENVMTKLNALLGAWIRNLTLDDILKREDSNKDLWDGFTIKSENGHPDIKIAGIGSDPLLKMFKDEWGILIEPHGIEIRDISPPDDIQEAANAERKQQFVAKGFAAETTGRLVAMIANLTGAKFEVVQKEFQDNLDGALLKYKSIIEMNLDIIKRRLGLGTGIQEIHVSSPEGYVAMLAKILHGGLSGGSGGGQASDGTSDSGGKKKKKKTKSSDDDNDDDDPDEGWEIK